MMLSFIFISLHLSSFFTSVYSYDKFDIRIDTSGQLGILIDDNLRVYDFQQQNILDDFNIGKSAGIKINDRIVALNGKSTTNLNTITFQKLLNDIELPYVLSIAPGDGRNVNDQEYLSYSSFGPKAEEDLLYKHEALISIRLGLQETLILSSNIAQFSGMLSCGYHQVILSNPIQGCTQLQGNPRHY